MGEESTKEYRCDSTQSRYTPDAGTVEGPIACGVCGTEMEIRRNCHGARSWAAAMGGKKSHYDSFTCPHNEELWHIQVIALRKKARDTCSGRLAQMLQEEANDVVTSRTPTKEDGLWRFFGG
jgi:hypothetical protein